MLKLGVAFSNWSALCLLPLPIDYPPPTLVFFTNGSGPYLFFFFAPVSHYYHLKFILIYPLQPRVLNPIVKAGLGITKTRAELDEMARE